MKNYDALYFGCKDEPGHFLFAPDGTRLRESQLPPEYLPVRYATLDCGLLPNGTLDATSLVHANGWTLVAFFDNSVDDRPSANSVFLVRGFLPYAHAIAKAKAAFPWVFARPKFPALRPPKHDPLAGPLELLRQVYEHAGNHAPDFKRHVLPPGLRDAIRDYLKATDAPPFTLVGTVTGRMPPTPGQLLASALAKRGITIVPAEDNRVRADVYLRGGTAYMTHADFLALPQFSRDSDPEGVHAWVEPAPDPLGTYVLKLRRTLGPVHACPLVVDDNLTPDVTEPLTIVPERITLDFTVNRTAKPTPVNPTPPGYVPRYDPDGTLLCPVCQARMELDGTTYRCVAWHDGNGQLVAIPAGNVPGHVTVLADSTLRYLTHANCTETPPGKDAPMMIRRDYFRATTLPTGETVTVQRVDCATCNAMAFVGRHKNTMIVRQV